MTSHIEETKRIFDEKFTVKSHAGTGIVRYTDADKIKSFITSRELALIERIEEWGKSQPVSLLDTRRMGDDPQDVRHVLLKDDLLTFLQTLK